MFLVNSRHPHFSATSFSSKSKFFHLMEAHLLPKLRCQFAEFLNQGSLKRLGILSPPTCVGLRYGHPCSSLRGFSWKHGITSFRARGPRHRVSALTRERICLLSPPTHLNRDVQHPAWLPFSVPPSVKRCTSGTGIINPFPITYAFRPRLRGRLTLGRLALPRKP